MRYALQRAAINAYLTWDGSGSTTLALLPSANGTVIKRGSGTTPLALITTANGVRAKVGAGSSVLALTSSANGGKVLVGSGQDAWTLALAQGMPDPHVLPSIWSYAHPSRRMVVDSQADVVVREGSRTVHVTPERRLTMVAPERTQ